MTSDKERKESAADEAGSATPPRKPETETRLDGEIVRDLEVDGQEADIRGGCLPTYAR
jgi:hypothetical protein